MSKIKKLRKKVAISLLEKALLDKKTFKKIRINNKEYIAIPLWIIENENIELCIKT